MKPNTSSTASHISRRGVVKLRLFLLAIGLLVLPACNAVPPATSELGALKQLRAACEPDRSPASLVLLDGTGSNNTPDITEERMRAVESVVRETAVCAGHLRLVAFSSSSAATTTLFDGPLVLDGATENAQLKKLPALVDEVVGEVKEAYEPAIASLPPGGSDVTAMYRLAAEWIAQLGDPFQLHLRVFTDGIQNVGMDLGAQVLSDEEATALAGRIEVPQLPEASVVVAGLGRVADPPLPSPLVEGLIIFYDALCQRTGASHCLSVTDYSAGR